MNNLTTYYESLPKATAPKTEFIKRIAERTGKGEATIRLWLRNKCKPRESKDLQILSEETGIDTDKLFEE